MMTTFHVIHIVAGFWLALANFTDMMGPAALSWNNFLIGLFVAGYNVFYLLGRRNVDLRS